MKNNPFDISFGKKPNQSISRHIQTTEIMEVFTSDVITQQIYLITGIRGSGKTVLMNSIANDLEKEKDWVVVRLNPERDLLQSMGAKLCEQRECIKLFENARINLQIFGAGISVEKKAVGDIEATIEKMLKQLKKAGKRLLLTVDEAENTPQMRVFASAFQIYVGQELPVFLLMTGLFDNIRSLQDEKKMTFLYRAPQIRMTPLNTGMIATRYEKVFFVTKEKAKEMARLTSGYPFAFQALGYAAWNHQMDETEYMEEYLQLLEEFVYEKIWSELSEKDKYILGGIAHSKNGKISEINQYLGLKENEINQYRKRLIDKGIVSGSEYGYLKFTLPLFSDFILQTES